MTRNYWEAKETYEYMKRSDPNWRDKESRYLETKVIIECIDDNKRITVYDANHFFCGLDQYENYDFLNLKVDSEKFLRNNLGREIGEPEVCIPVEDIFQFWESYKEEGTKRGVTIFPRKLIGTYEIREFYIKFNDVEDWYKISVNAEKYVRRKFKKITERNILMSTERYEEIF